MTPQSLDHLLHLVEEETSQKLQSSWGIASFCGTLSDFRYYYSIKYTISTALSTRAFSSPQRRSVEGNNSRLFVYGGDICIPAAVISAQSSRVYEQIIIHEWALTYDSHDQNPFMMEIFKMSPIEDDSSALLMDEERIVKALFPVETNDTPPIFKRSYARLNVDKFEESCPQTVLTAKKRKRDIHKYTVFGRITCRSSISIQRKENSTHYFIEVEHQDMKRREQNLVNVMMIGSLSIRLHVCMVPGRFIFLAEAVKVFSQECQTFLLQSKNEISEGGKRQYRVYLWDQSSVIPTNVLPWSIDITTKKELIESEAYKTWKEGSLLTYEGQVTDICWNQCLQLDSSIKSSSGDGGFSVWLLLYHYPNFNELFSLRIGARIRVYNAHLVDNSRSEGETWAIGACVRSHITIINFAPFKHSAVVDSISPTRNEVPRPPVSLPSEFGAIQHQPLPITFWRTSLFRLLTLQFNFDPAKHARLRSMYHFPMLKRRHLTMRIVEAFSPQLYFFLSKKLTRSTLGSMFLNPEHERMPTECSSIKLPLALQDVVKQRCMMISQLTSVASEIMADNVHSFEKHLKDCFIIGRLSGTLGNGDLTLSDQTSRIAVTLSETIDSLEEEKIFWAKHYAPKNFTDALYIVRNVRVRVCQHTAITKPLPKKFQRAYSLLIAWKDLAPVHVAAPIPNQPSSIGITEIPKVIMFVTSIYPMDTTASWSLPGIRDYQLIRGILARSGMHTKTLRFAQVLMPVLRVPWLIKPGRTYVITNVQKKADAISDLIALGYKRLHVASLQPSETRLFDTICRFCKLLATQVEHCEKLNKELLAFVSSYTNQIETPCERRYGTFYGQSDSAVDLSESECDIERLDSCWPTDLADNEILKWLRNPSGTSFSWKERKHTTVHTYFFLHILPALFRESLSIGTPRGLSRFQLKQFKAQTEDSVVLEPALHQPHLRSVAGRINSIRFLQRSLPRKSLLLHRTAEQIMTCNLQDFKSLEVVEVHINLTKFGFHGGFHMGLNVLFMNLETYVARSTYKVHLDWGQYSSIQQLGQNRTPFTTVTSSNENMKTSNLLQLYLESHLIDRTWHRWVARVVHINYFVLKRRCRSCHAELSLQNTVYCEWQHPQHPQHPQNARNTCPVQHHYPYREHRQLDRDEFLGDVSYVNTCIRGLIDDGSAQAEVFAENQTAWDLLRASESQRRYFEGIMTQKLSKLGYFFSATAQSSVPSSHLLPSKSIEEDLGRGISAEYYEKQLSNIIRLCVNQNRRPMIIIGQRFYSKKNQRKEKSHEGDCTSVVSFGADLRLTTKTRPVIQVEAKRVDPLEIKADTRRLLVALEE